MYSVTYLIPVYNGASTIIDSIESIINDEWENTKIVIIDDGSTDNTFDILNTKYLHNEKIKVIRTKNIGVGAALNLGLTYCDSDFIFRLDSDDVNLKGRTKSIINYMVENNIDVCGCYVETFPNPSDIWKYPKQHSSIVAALPFCSPFAHPAVTFGPRVIKDLKYTNTHSQDLQLWRYLSTLGYKFGNLDIVGVKYRLHENQQTKTLKHKIDSIKLISRKNNILILVKLIFSFKIPLEDKLWIMRRYLQIGSFFQQIKIKIGSVTQIEGKMFRP